MRLASNPPRTMRSPKKWKVRNAAKIETDGLAEANTVSPRRARHLPEHIKLTVYGWSELIGLVDVVSLVAPPPAYIRISKLEQSRLQAAKPQLGSAFGNTPP